jgi:hypothetical protein
MLLYIWHKIKNGTKYIKKWQEFHTYFKCCGTYFKSCCISNTFAKWIQSHKKNVYTPEYHIVICIIRTIYLLFTTQYNAHSTMREQHVDISLAQGETVNWKVYVGGGTNTLFSLTNNSRVWYSSEKVWINLLSSSKVDPSTVCRAIFSYRWFSKY